MSATLSAILTFAGTVLAAAIAGLFVYRRAVKVDRPAQVRAAEQILIDKWQEYSESLEKRVDRQEIRLASQADKIDAQDDTLRKLVQRVEHLEEAEKRAAAAEKYLSEVLDWFRNGGGWPPPERSH